MLIPGQKVLVNWGEKHGWLPGVFIEYTTSDINEDFERIMVKMDNGFACHHPGYHPQCVIHAPEFV